MLIVLSIYLPYMLVAKRMGLHKHRTTRIKIKSSCLPTPWVTYSWLLSFLLTSCLLLISLGFYFWFNGGPSSKQQITNNQLTSRRSCTSHARSSKTSSVIHDSRNHELSGNRQLANPKLLINASLGKTVRLPYFFHDECDSHCKR